MKILVDVPVLVDALARLQASGRHEVECLSPPADEARVVDPARLRCAEVLFCSVPPVNFEEMKSLRWIQVASTGYSQLFGLNLPARGVRATNSRGCFDVPIAEWTMAMIVNLARDLRGMIRNQDGAVWDRSAVHQREIRGLTVGLWGYGGIGRETARVARQLGLRVHVMTRRGAGPRHNVYCVPGTGDLDGVLPDAVFTSGEEMEFLSCLDFLVVALPLTAATEGLIGEREFRALPRSAFVLNPARGPIIREEALLRALTEGWIAGAALDTHFQYPLPAEHPLWKMPNVILTPHISGSGGSSHYLERLWDIFGTNLERIAAGRPLLNELTPDELAGR